MTMFSKQRFLRTFFGAALTISAVANASAVGAQSESTGGPPNYDATYRKIMAGHEKVLAAIKPVTDDMQRRPNDGDWLTYRRTQSSMGYSPLSQINSDNVHSLDMAWTWGLPPNPNEITPLVHDGVMFVAVADRVQALDATNGELLWQYVRVLPAALTNGSASPLKNLAIYGDRIFAPTADGHLVALDVKTGKLVWDHTILGPLEQAAQIRVDGGPTIAKGKVLQGVSGCFTYKGGCFIVALDTNTGNEAWRFDTVARPGKPGGDTWNQTPLSERFGGAVWTSGSYDPELNLVYFGVGQTYDLATLLGPEGHASVSNNALYLDSTVALDPDTGLLAWYYQHLKHDAWDYDWAFEQTLVDMPVAGRNRKLLISGSKSGLFDTIDRTDGTYVTSNDAGLQNIVAKIEPQTGEKVYAPISAAQPNVTKTICPDSGGARNWPATSLDPIHHLLYIPLTESCMDYTWHPRDASATAKGGVDIKWVLKPRPDSDGNFGRLEAMNLDTGKIAWEKRRRAPETSAALATAGGIVFDGSRDRMFHASNATTGNVLWETQLNAVPSSTPVTYRIGHVQYVAVVSGGGGAHEATWSSLTPELDTPSGGSSIWVFKLAGAQ